MDKAHIAASMVVNYAAAYQYYTSRGFEGFGAHGKVGYAVIAFQRYGLINDYLASVVILDTIPERTARFKLFAQALEPGGNVSAVAAIYRQIAQSDPTDSEVAAVLARLPQ